MSRTILRAAISTALAALLLSGCLVGPKYQKPPAMAQAPPAAYKESPGAATPSNGTTASAAATGTAATGTTAVQAADAGEWKVAQPQDAMLKGKWWEIYGDNELNALEEKLAIDNQTIKQYFANYMEARTLVAEARAQLYPTVGTGPSYARSQASANAGAPGTTPANRSQSDLTNLPVDLSWEPDLWGRVRNQIRAQQYNAQVSAADLENVRLSEQASLAVYFFEIRGQDALAAIYQQTVADDQKARGVDAVAVRDGSGHGDFGGGGAEYFAECTVGADQPGRGAGAVRTRDRGADGERSFGVLDCGEGAERGAAGGADRRAVAVAGAAAGHCGVGAGDGRGERGDRSCAGGVLSRR